VVSQLDIQSRWLCGKQGTFLWSIDSQSLSGDFLINVCLCFASTLHVQRYLDIRQHPSWWQDPSLAKTMVDWCSTVRWPCEKGTSRIYLCSSNDEYNLITIDLFVPYLADHLTVRTCEKKESFRRGLGVNMHWLLNFVTAVVTWFFVATFIHIYCAALFDYLWFLEVRLT
jgi:hypothetical protein